MSKKREPGAHGSQATITVTGLRERLMGFDGKPIVERDPVTRKALPEKDQPTLGDVLLNLVGSMKAANGKEAIALFRVGQEISAAQEGGQDWEANEKALGVLRKAVDQNAPAYVALVIGQVSEAVGTGEADP